MPTLQNLSSQFEHLCCSLDDSSDKNRNFLIAFMLLEIYILVAVSGISDKQLLLRDTVFAFPFIDVKVPILGIFNTCATYLSCFSF